MIEELTKQGWSLIPHFADATACEGLRGRIEAARAGGLLQKAGIGSGVQKQVAASRRGDWIQWLEADDPTPVLGDLEMLRQRLNREAFLGLRRFEAHLAYYPPGTHYEKHVDQFQGSEARRVSFVLYLNRQWTPEEGGVLRIEADAGPVEVEPREGSLVVFLSELPHQVMPTRADRYSLTGWFRTDEASFG